jgi:hypothetical protein
MSVEERRRLELYDAARTILGEAAADTLLELLPMDLPQLATKQDLAVLSAELRGEISGLRAEMHELFREQTNRILMFVLPTMLSGVGLAFVAARF